MSSFRMCPWPRRRGSMGWRGVARCENRGTCSVVWAWAVCYRQVCRRRSLNTLDASAGGEIGVMI